MSEWINIKDLIPGEKFKGKKFHTMINKNFLISEYFGSGNFLIEDAEYLEFLDKCSEQEIKDKKLLTITHWMPLSEPPKSV